jgi:FAD/FMN-containing dehydrogenase
MSQAKIAPETISELVHLVQNCRRQGQRLRPVSSRSSDRHGAASYDAETLTVDLSRFDEIVRVDRRNRVMLFEAGVGFDALVRSARAAGLRVMLPLCPRPGQSALTAYLDREPTLYPRFQWDMSDPLLCTELVLGTGELFRTGSAAGPGNLEQQWRAGDAQKNPMGPGPANLMRIFQGARGAYGIVTWCSAKAEALPAFETLYVAGSDTIEPLIEVAYGLLRRGHPDICLLLDGSGLAAVEQRERMTWERARERARPWNLVFSLAKARIAGDRKLAYVEREVSELLERNGLTSHLADIARDDGQLLAVLTDPEHPMNAHWWKRAGRAAVEAVYLQSTMDRVPDLLDVAQRVVSERGDSERDVLVYVQPQLGGRCCHLEWVLPCETPSAALPLASALTAALSAAGGYFSRARGADRSTPVRGAGALPMLRKLENIFDPDGVFAPNRPHFVHEPGERSGNLSAAPHPGRDAR